MTPQQALEDLLRDMVKVEAWPKSSLFPTVFVVQWGLGANRYQQIYDKREIAEAIAESIRQVVVLAFEAGIRAEAMNSGRE